jgi:hypothetical protein
MSTLLKNLKIVPRYDLQTPFVHLSYEQTTTIDGESAMVPAEDIYPNPPPTAALSQFNGLRATIDLQGLVVTGTPPANIVCDPIQADPANVTASIPWWLARHPQYTPFDDTAPGGSAASDPNNPIESFELVQGSLVITPTDGGALLNLPNELRSGRIDKWMGFKIQRLTIAVKANITHRNGNVVLNHPITHQCLSTNATTGAYSSQTVTQYPEPIPTGLAEFLYNAAGILQYDGSVTVQEEEVSGMVAPGNLLNLTGGNLAAWTTMNAQVQSITESLDNGTTLVEFGPAKHLGAGELVDLLRVNRSRTIFYWPTLQTSGNAGSAGSGDSVADYTLEKNASSTPGFTQSHVVSGAVDGTGPNLTTQVAGLGALLPTPAAFSFWSPNGPFTLNQGNIPATPGAISINTQDIAADIPSGVFIQLRKIPLCLNGVSGTMYFLCSQFFPD